MSDFKKVLESRVKIRFHDCDPYNHLNNSRYIDYIMMARGDQLIENYNLDIYRIAREQRLGWVLAQTQISYFDPALLMEEVTVQTQLTGYSLKSLQVEAFMLNYDKSRIKAVMWAKLVHYDLVEHKSREHSKNLLDLFQQVVNPLADETTFDQRIKSLKTIV